MSDNAEDDLKPNGGRRNGDADPTFNVRDLVDSAERRQDDLREQESRWRDKLDAERDHYHIELRRAEAQRIDAVRAIDVTAVQQRAVEAETRATALAGVVASSAEAMRAQVAAAATAAATSLAAALEPVQKDIADLRRAQYEAQGQKTQVVETRASDADFAPILAAIQRLEAGASLGAGRAEQYGETKVNQRTTVTAAIALVSIVIAILIAIGTITITRTGSGNNAPQTTTVTVPTQQAP